MELMLLVAWSTVFLLLRLCLSSCNVLSPLVGPLLQFAGFTMDWLLVALPWVISIGLISLGLGWLLSVLPWFWSAQLCNVHQVYAMATADMVVIAVADMAAMCKFG
ncbi:hypothetical protein U1Q18_024495 [Sarracenia purpurea var. burkii]